MLKFILLILFINTFITAQIIITEEVNLNESEATSGLNFTMPFYGKVSGTFIWSEFQFGRLQAVKIQAGSQVVFKGPMYHGYVWPTSWKIDNVPANTPIIVTVYNKCENENLIEAVSWAVPISSNNYDIMYNHPGYRPLKATSLKFTSTTPPSCNPEFDCVLQNFLPEISLIKRDNGYTGRDICIDPNNPPGITIPIFDDPEVNNLDIQVCFNKNAQQWWFSLNNNHKIIFSYLSEVCANNLNPNQILIDDYTFFPMDYSCDEIIMDISHHFTYGAPYAKYV